MKKILVLVDNYQRADALCECITSITKMKVSR